MSVYPMTIYTESMDHKGGTKSYHFMIIANAQGKSVLVNRWGKTGAFGQFQVQTFEKFSEATAAKSKKRADRRNNGYQIGNVDKQDQIFDADGLRKFLGHGYGPQFGPDNLLHLDPEYDVTGVRGAKVDYDADGNKIDNAKRVDRAAIEEAQRREREEQQAREQVQYSANPNFGLF